MVQCFSCQIVQHIAMYTTVKGVKFNGHIEKAIYKRVSLDRTYSMKITIVSVNYNLSMYRLLN